MRKERLLGTAFQASRSAKAGILGVSSPLPSSTISALCWGAIYSCAALTGQHLPTDRLETDWQVLPLSALTAHPLRSVWYLHIQPPIWNLVVGSLARWSPLSLALSLQLLMLVSGMVLAWSLASIARALGVGHRTTIAVSLLASANSAVLMFGFLPVYELPSMALLALTIRAVTLRTGRLAPLISVSLLATAVVMTRSMYHPVWLIGVLVLVIWSQRASLSRRSILIAVIVPLAVIGSWTIKNQTMFGTTSLSSWTSMNLMRSVRPAIDQGSIKAMRADGTISGVGAIGPFADYETYASVAPPCTPQHSDPVLSQPLRSVTATASATSPPPAVNFNYECFLPIYSQAGSDTFAMIRAQPRAWALGRMWALNNWFGVVSPREPERSPVVSALNTVTNIGLLAVARPALPKSWNAGRPIWVHSSPVSLLLILATLVVLAAGARHSWRLLRSRAADTGHSLIIAVAGMTTAWTVFVGVFGELGEQERLRNMTDPIVLAAAGAVVTVWWADSKWAVIRRRPLERIVAVRIAAVVLLLGFGVVAVGQGSEQRAVLAVRPVDVAPLEPTASSGAADSLPVEGTPNSSTSTTVAPPPVCHRIIHLGDSNLGMAMGGFQQAYKKANVDAIVDFANGRAATAAQNDGTSALTAIAHFQQLVPADGRCWILALGSEDAASSAYAGIDPSIDIHKIIDALGDEQVMWITPVMAGTTGVFNLAAATRYNQALLSSVGGHKNFSVLDWYDIALDHLDQFGPDGVHYQPPLYALLIETVMSRIDQIWDMKP